MNISSSGGGGDSNHSLKIQSTNSTSSHNSINNANPNANEAGHYVVTAHRPGGVLLSVKCSFLEEGSTVCNCKFC